MKKTLFIILLFFTSIIQSQTDTTESVKDIQTILEDASEGRDDSYLYDIIEYLSENPIAINSASIIELQKIPFLDKSSATEIIRQRNLAGGFSNSEQLLTIGSVDKELILKILPFIKFEDEKSFSIGELLQNKFQLVDFNLRARGLYDIQKEEAFANGKFPDSRWKIYNRFIATDKNKFRIGILAEKDAGETTLTDFTTFHLQLKNIGIIKNIVLGDFIYEFGQGLAMWSRYAYSKGSEAVEVLPRNSRGVIPYLSSDENQFLRGLSANIEIDNLTFETFFSIRKLDGSIDSVTNQFTSLTIDGLHRTQNEIAKKDRIEESILGASVNYKFSDYMNLGLLVYRNKFSNAILDNSALKPDGDEFTYFSTSYDFSFDKINFTGETSFFKGNIASLNNALFNIDKNFALVFSYRNYSQSYWNIHSSGFGERDYAQNESGFYSGIKLKTGLGVIDFYFDQYKFFMMSDRYNFPSTGTDFLINWNYSPLPNLELRMRYKNERVLNDEQVIDTYGIVANRKQNVRVEINYRVSKQIQIRTRGEVVIATPDVDIEKDNGFLIFQDVRYSLNNTLQLNGRIIFFRTDSYNSRVYEFENDLTGVMTNPGLYGDGMRWYIVARYITPLGLSISFKYSELIKPGENFLGSGDTQIKGNVDNRFSFQLDLKL